MTDLSAPRTPSVRLLPIEWLAPCRRRRVRLPTVSASVQALVSQYGVFQPILARALEEPRRYEILANLVSWLAAQRAGLHDVPVTVLEGLDDAAADRFLDSRDDGPVATARRFKAEKDQLEASGVMRGATGVVARRFGVSRSSVAHALRLLTLPETVLEAIEIGALHAGHAKALAGVDDPDRQSRLAASTIERGWSVRRLEKECRTRATVHDTRVNPPVRSPDMLRLERRMSAALGCEVRVDEGRGRFEINYHGNLDVLDGILERLGCRE